MDINRRVKNLIRKYKTHCPFELAARLNIDIWYLDLGDSCRGYYLRTLRRRYIAINKDLPEEWKRFVCAHELGHDRLHKGLGYYFIEQNTLFHPGKFESQANKFAMHLILDGVAFEEGVTQEQICNLYGIPASLGPLLSTYIGFGKKQN